MKAESGKEVFLLQLLLILAVAAFFISVSFGSHHLLHTVIQNVVYGHSAIYAYTKEHFFMSLFLFCLVYVFSATIAFPLESPLCILAGYYFGLTIGSVSAVFSATLGALNLFLLVKFFFHDWFHRRFEGKKIKTIIARMDNDAFSYLLFLRLVPIFPFFLINVGLSFSKVSVRDFVLATFLGLIPSTVVFVFAGTQLATIRDTGQIITPSVFGALALIALVSLIPFAWKKYKGKAQIPTLE